MNSLMINTEFSNLLEEKFQSKRNVVNLVSEILDMDKKSVYRRLNNEVFFTLSEVCNIARHAGISIDSFIRKCYPDSYSNMLMNLISAPENIEHALNIIEQNKEYLTLISEQPDSEMGCLTNYFPTFFHMQNREIYTIYEYNLHYLAGYKQPYARFKEEEETRRLVDAVQDLSLAFEKMKHYKMILGRNPVHLLLQDVVYIKNLGLITGEEYAVLKKEVGRMLDKLEDCVENGNSENAGTTYEVYLSDTVIDMNCYYSWSGAYSLSIIQLYVFGVVCSYEDERNQNMRKWLDSLKNNSVQITGSSRSERIAFFAEQRRILESY